MKSWSQWFADGAERRRKERKQPVGFIVTDDGEIPLNTEAGRAAYSTAIRRALERNLND